MKGIDLSANRMAQSLFPGRPRPIRFGETFKGKCIKFFLESFNNVFKRLRWPAGDYATASRAAGTVTRIWAFKSLSSKLYLRLKNQSTVSFIPFFTVWEGLNPNNSFALEISAWEWSTSPERKGA